MSKTIRTGCTLLFLALAACATDYHAAKVNDGIWSHMAHIGLHSEKVGDHEYLIVANGAVASKDEDVVDAWNTFAVKIADGRRFTKESRMEDYVYYESYIRHNARCMIGRIVTVQ